MNSVDDHGVSTANNPEQNPVDARDRTDLSRRPPLGKFALSAVVIAVILGLALNPTFYSETIVSAYSSLAIFGTVIVIGVIRRSWVDLLSILGGTALLYLLDYRVMGFKPAFMSGFSFAGLAAFAVFGIRTVWAQRDERKILLYGLVPVTLFVMSEYLASSMLEVTEKLHPKTLDLFLYSFDSSLGVQFSFLAGQVFRKFLWLRTVCLVFYIALPLPLALVYAGQLRKLGKKALFVMTAFLITGPIGILCYNMLPACGPIHLFGRDFPFHPLTTAQAARMTLETLPVFGARNAIPSLHMTWVLLIWWNSKGLPRWVRAIALSFVWATALATTGSGEHYVIDLVVAFPFSLMIQALSSYSLPFRSGPRRVAFLFGTFTTLAWLMLLSFATRLFWISPILPWVLVTATVAISLVLWHRLLNALFGSDQTSSSQTSEANAEPLARAQGA
jgi:hypothetical protein